MPDDVIKRRQSESVWKKLTRLFRSGPVVRHKIAAGEKFVEPQGTARAFKKEISSLYVHSMASYGQYERLARYADYSEMEFTPEIASALDIYADEVTAKNENGEILQILSKDGEIKRILESLFYDILNIEFNIWSWVRNLCKYGDFILFVDANEENGLLNLIPIPINEIEREEGYDKKDPMAVRFRWLTQGNVILENWQIVHFRMLGNDNFLPYGSSVIEPARRIWRQLILIEDAMLVYRIVRSPERRVFKIDVGNIPPDQVEAYIEKVKTQLKRQQVVDPNTGRVDLRYNPLSVDEDYFIPVRGDRSSDISTLAGGQFTGDIDDVQYIQNKLFGALKIPKAYLSYEGDTGSKATLAQQDVRFARTIDRIQKIVVSEMNKIAILHLFLLGYRGEELVDFELRLANSSIIAEQQYLELWRARLEIAGMAQEGVFDREFIWKRVFKLSDEEIDRLREGKKFDKLEDLALEQVQLPGAEPEVDPDQVPGEDQLPSTLGGLPPVDGEGEEPPPGGPDGGMPPPGGADGASLPGPDTAGVSHPGPVLGETEGSGAIQKGDMVTWNAFDADAKWKVINVIADWTGQGYDTAHLEMDRWKEYYDARGIPVTTTAQYQKKVPLAALTKAVVAEAERVQDEWGNRWYLRHNHNYKKANKGPSDPHGTKFQSDLLAPAENPLKHAALAPMNHMRGDHKPSTADAMSVIGRFTRNRSTENRLERTGRLLSESVEDDIDFITEELEKLKREV